MRCIQPQDFGFWLIPCGSFLKLHHQQLPYGSAAEWHFVGKRGVVIGQWQNQPLWLLENIDSVRDSHYVSLRSFLSLPEREFNLLNRGVALHYFIQQHRYCGKCGAKTQFILQDWAVECVSCYFRHYPVICPSIIVAIRKHNTILLANHQRHKEAGMYTVLAGFVEVGETIEQTVHREVFEECAIKITNLRYVKSQPWAFPNSLMLAFLADYESGEINLQTEELYDANWFAYNRLPNIPEQGTIARYLIEQTVALCKKDTKEKP